MAEKTGAGGQLQTFDAETGRYSKEAGNNSANSNKGYDSRDDFKQIIDRVNQVRSQNSGSDKSTHTPYLSDSNVDAIKSGKGLSDAEIEDVCTKLAKIYRPVKRGDEDTNLKAILSETGFTQTPKRLRKQDFIKQVQSGTILYRGLHGDNADKYAKYFYDGDMWVGTGFGGNGVYMSKDANEASMYRHQDGAIVSAVMPADFRIADDEVRKEYSDLKKKYDEKYKWAKTNSKEQNAENDKLRGALSYGVFCVLKGYDAYLPAVSHEKNVVILNRGKLVIGENNEQEKFIDFNERGI